MMTILYKDFLQQNNLPDNAESRAMWNRTTDINHYPAGTAMSNWGVSPRQPYVPAPIMRLEQDTPPPPPANTVEITAHGLGQQYKLTIIEEPEMWNEYEWGWDELEEEVSDAFPGCKVYECWIGELKKTLIKVVLPDIVADVVKYLVKPETYNESETAGYIVDCLEDSEYGTRLEKEDFDNLIAKLQKIRAEFD